MEHVEGNDRSGAIRELRRWLRAQFDGPVHLVARECEPGGPSHLGECDLLPERLVFAAAAASEVGLWDPEPGGASWLLIPRLEVEGLSVTACVEPAAASPASRCPAPALLAWGREVLARLLEVPRSRADRGGTRYASQLLRRLRVSDAPPRFQAFVLEKAAELLPGRLMAWVPADEAEPILHVGVPAGSIDTRLAETLAGLRRAASPGFTNDPDGPQFESFAPPGNRNEGHLLVLLRPGEARIEGESAELIRIAASAIASQRSNSRMYSDLKDLLTGVIRALTAAIDAKDAYTSGHSERVARIASRLAEELGLGEEKRSDLYLMGILHDIGKIGIDDKILKKQEELTDDEYREIQEHVEIGVKILSGLTALRHLLPGVAHHHESYDGTGYPDRLAGEQIPFEARILAVADAFDAMSSSRPYRPRLSPSRIASIFQNDRGGQWDPRIVQALLSCWKEIESIQEKGLGESLMRVVSTTVGRGSGLGCPRGKPS